MFKIDKQLITNFFKNNFSYKNNIKRLIYFGLGFAIALILCLPIYLIVINLKNSYNDVIPNFFYIHVTENRGVSFSTFEDWAGWQVNLLQLGFAFIVLLIILFITPRKYYILFLSLVFFAGLFNVIDRGMNFTINYHDEAIVKDEVVLDYFQFAWFNAIFNMQDAIISGSVLGLAITYIIEIFKENNNIEKIKIYQALKIQDDFILFIDCTQKTLYLAIIQNNQLCASYEQITNNNLTDIIYLHINTFLNYLHLKPQDIKTIYTTNGPGSYTGLRVTSLVLKSWSIVYPKVNIFCINSILLQAKDNCISTLDARGGKYFFALVKNNKIVEEIKVVDKDELEKVKTKNKLPIVSDYSNNIYDCLLLHLPLFKKVSMNDFTPLYIKKAI